MCHNSNDTAPNGWFAEQIERLSAERKILRAMRAEQPDLPFHLTGSHRKTAYALEKNVATMIEEHGLNRVGFLTLTVGDENQDLGFRQVWDAAEASRRINSVLTGLLTGLFGRMIVVTERHQSGAIHFHLLVECRADIRTGLDFQAIAGGDYGSASAYLRDVWAVLRERLPGYGFGRSELLPIKSSGEAVSRYVSKYVEKNRFNRVKADKGKRLVRYSGWGKAQMKPNEFSWATPAAIEWRANARCAARIVGVERREDVGKAFGHRWAWRLTRAFKSVEDMDTSRLTHFEAKQHAANLVWDECIYPQWQWWEQLWEIEAEMPIISPGEPALEQQMALFPERYKEAA